MWAPVIQKPSDATVIEGRPFVSQRPVLVQGLINNLLPSLSQYKANQRQVGPLDLFHHVIIMHKMLNLIVFVDYMVINSQTGVVGWGSAVAGVYNVVIKATNQMGTATTSYTLTVTESYSCTSYTT
jgi:hypothetical protein